jgi:hypothetical protein
LIKKESDLSVRKQCELLRLNRSSVYHKPATATEEAQQQKEELMARLDWWHTKLCGIGSRKLVVLLRQEGYKVGRKLVRRLMQEMGLYTIYPKENLSKRNFKEAIVPYLLRNRQIQFSNEVCLLRAVASIFICKKLPCVYDALTIYSKYYIGAGSPSTTSFALTQLCSPITAFPLITAPIMMWLNAPISQ